MGGMVPLGHGNHGAVSATASATEQRIWGGIGSTQDSQTAKASAIAPFPIEVTAMQFAFLFHYPEGDFFPGSCTSQPIALSH